MKLVDLDDYVNNHVVSLKKQSEEMLANIKEEELVLAQKESKLRNVKSQYEREIASKTHEAFANGIVSGSNAEKRNAELNGFLMETRNNYEWEIESLTYEVDKQVAIVKVAWQALQSFNFLVQYQTALLKAIGVVSEE